MSIFLAGATGVIGVRLIPRLVAAGHPVTAVARTDPKRRNVVELGATAVSVDLFDAAALRQALAGHDIVINLATKIPPSSRALLPGAWRENDRMRSIAASNLATAAAAAGAARLIQESFAPVYPDRGSEWIDETTPIAPARYNRSVVDAEAAASRFGESGRTAVVLRFAFFYGPDSDFTRDMLRYVRKGWAPALGDPAGYVSSVTHDDAAGAVLAALDVPGGIYNVVDDEPIRRREFYDAMAAALKVEPPKFLPAWLARLTGSIGETLARSQRISNRKLKSASRWQPDVPSARQGWPLLIEQLREHERSERLAAR